MILSYVSQNCLVTIIVDLDRKNTPSCPIYKRKLSQQKFDLSGLIF